MTLTDNARTENDAVAEIAQDACEPHELLHGGLYGIVVRNDAKHQIIDMERYLDAPRRKRGSAKLITADSFVAYVDKHKDAAAEVYADPRALTVTAVFNGHEGDADAAGWGDHRAVLGLQRTDAWQRWKARDNVLGGQLDFAEHIENSLEDIIEPAAADMLEIAQHFHAHRQVQFRTAKRLSDGQTQFVYDEQVNASAGQKGDLAIPSEFYLSLQPFEGASPYKVLARLRYRLGERGLQIGYKLDRPEDYERHAFDDLLTDIGDQTGITPLMGTPVQLGA